jgi:regulator of sigma E protease
MTVLPFIGVLTVIIFVHEYGHYIVARWCGVHSEVFSIGLGKELWARTDKHGTRWRIALLPIGGYVKFLGDTNAASMPTEEAEANAKGLSEFERNHSFPMAALWKRACIVAAGPFFNFILSIVIFAGLAMGFGMIRDTPVVGPVISQDSLFQEGDVIKSVNDRPVNTLFEAVETLVLQDINPAKVTIERNGKIETFLQDYTSSTKVGFVYPGSAAENADLQTDDIILTISSQPVRDFRDVQTYVGEWKQGDDPLRFEVLRGERNLNIDITPALQERKDPDTQEIKLLPTIGVGSAGTTTEDIFGFQPSRERLGALEAISFGLDRTYSIITHSLDYVADIITGRQGADQLGGPIGVARFSGEAAESGFENFLGFIALISTSIGLLNLFPIPILDGGHLVFYAIEAIRGRPASKKFMEISTSVGLTLLLGIMVFATWNDIMRL